MLTHISLDQLILILILAVQVMIWFRLPKNVDTYKRRQRKQRIDRVKDKARNTVAGIKDGIHRRRISHTDEN